MENNLLEKIYLDFYYEITCLTVNSFCLEENTNYFNYDFFKDYYKCIRFNTDLIFDITKENVEDFLLKETTFIIRKASKSKFKDNNQDLYINLVNYFIGTCHPDRGNKARNLLIRHPLHKYR